MKRIMAEVFYPLLRKNLTTPNRRRRRSKTHLRNNNSSNNLKGHEYNIEGDVDNTVHVQD